MPKVILSERQCAGVDSSTFCKNDKHPECWTLRSLLMIAQGLGVPIEWLFGDHTKV